MLCVEAEPEASMAEESANIDKSQKKVGRLGPKEFLTIFLDFLDQPRIVAIVTYILIFRLSCWPLWEK